MPKTRDASVLTQLGHRIRARRLWLDLAQDRVAKELDVSQQQFQGYEAGSTAPSADRLLQIATALQTTAGALLGEGRTGPDPLEIEIGAILSDPSVAAILKRLREMDPPRRKLAHALVCTVAAHD
jgi:transcriptional regulator with XRE-family HTH domain